jgi:hypothetical protein
MSQIKVGCYWKKKWAVSKEFSHFLGSFGFAKECIPSNKFKKCEFSSLVKIYFKKYEIFYIFQNSVKPILHCSHPVEEAVIWLIFHINF